MKTIAIFHALFVLVGFSFAQVRTQLSPSKIVPELGMFKAPDIPDLVDVGPVDVSKLLPQDALEEGANVPFRFGIGMDVNYTTQNSGKWFDVARGKVWKLKVRSIGAYSINLAFNQLVLPDGGLLYIYSEDKSMLFGPVSKNDIPESGAFGTDLIRGQTVILEIFEPTERIGETKVQLSRVIHGDKKMFDPMNYGDADQTCTSDVKCAGSLYEDASGGVAMVLLADGTRVCSGSLLNNGCADFTPSFLTAFHCLDIGNTNPPSPCDLEWGNGGLSQNEINRAQNFVFRFQYKSPTCDGPEPPSYQWFTFNGAAVRSGWFNTDFALLEMNQRPRGNQNTGIRYLGWTRDQTPPRTSYHHPAGDVMKLSLSDGAQNWNAIPIVWNVGCGRTNTSPAQSHWEVTLTNGRVQGGSSGGPILDQPVPWAPRYVVGQLHGGEDSCTPQTTWYGRFDLSWAGGGTATTSLAPWLTNDPNVASVLSLASPYIQGAQLVCSTPLQFNLIDVPPSSTHNVVWTTSANLSIVSQGHSFVSVKYSGVQPGTGTITANISNTNTALCTVSTPFSVNVEVGEFSASQIIISGQQGVCPNQYYTYTADVPGGHHPGYSYSWTYPSGWSLMYQSQNGVVLFTGSAQAGQVKCSVTNSCGPSNYSAMSVFPISCGFSLAYYPNPAQDELTVSFAGKGKSKLPYSLHIYDERANLMYSTNSDHETITVRTATFPEGGYFLQILHKEGIIRRQIFISR